MSSLRGAACTYDHPSLHLSVIKCRSVIWSAGTRQGDCRGKEDELECLRSTTSQRVLRFSVLFFVATGFISQQVEVVMSPVTGSAAKFLIASSSNVHSSYPDRKFAMTTAFVHQFNTFRLD
ncbi:hypothetical protein E2C01_049387 [Portunus trituberculatus]|uniref:Uncharacterized protein n=1 Tax=Portunus trituberculatus TaxID=210409 RepID=A0A5B7G9B2_PORTR|nr:hypothetical protein [Portunus trituberculatus]